MAHKWAEVIKAWADGKPVQVREWYGRAIGTIPVGWGPWQVHPSHVAPITIRLGIEYRVEPEQEPHQWQREKEAFLAGKRVEFRMKRADDCIPWQTVDKWLVEDCVLRQDPPIPIWDREWLDFRIADTWIVRYMDVGSSLVAGFKMHQGPGTCTHGKPNLKLTWLGKELIKAEVL